VKEYIVRWSVWICLGSALVSVYSNWIPAVPKVESYSAPYIPSYSDIVFIECDLDSTVKM